MDDVLGLYLSGLQLGEAQVSGNLAVFPVFTEAPEGPAYLLLPEALAEEAVTITEVDGGSVPELKVVNHGKIPVLLLDGMELVGAKQNRVLNTTILLRELSATIIPVSCVEQGRWRHVSPRFTASEHVMPSRQRARKLRAVSRSLAEDGDRQSDQHEVWEGVAEMSRQADIVSPTSAMRDVYHGTEGELEEMCRAFSGREGQRGLLAFINGEPAGLEVLSRAPAYEKTHDRWARSFAMDALLAREKLFRDPARDAAQAFLQAAATCKDKSYKAIGYGNEHRLQSSRMTGLALTEGDAVIHLSLLAVDAEGYTERRRDQEVIY